MSLIAGIILLAVGLIMFVPAQMIFPFPYGLGVVATLVIAGIFLIAKSRKKNSALDLLKERYAKGEIIKEEFDKMKDDLS